MSWVEDKLVQQFREWEARGRGWEVFEDPIAVEPPFRPFRGHFLPASDATDDGRQYTWISGFIERLAAKLNPEPDSTDSSEEEEPEPREGERGEIIELQTLLSATTDVPREAFGQFLTHLSSCKHPLSFEVLGTEKATIVQLAIDSSDMGLVRKQVEAYFPDAMFKADQGVLEKAWAGTDAHNAIVEFGLKREFMLLLSTGKLDPLIGICGALSGLRQAEAGLFQVLFKQVENEWSQSILNCVTDSHGKPFFVNRSELVGCAEKKTSRPLYAVVVRIAARALDFDRSWEIARELAAPLAVFSNPQGNELIPLSNEEYPYQFHEEDVLRRQTRRSGMILNADELLGFVHLPSSSVRSATLSRQTSRTKALPSSLTKSNGLLLGCNTNLGIDSEVYLSPEERVRHLHVIGASGTGKSTLLFNLIKQDIENGEGVAVLDPHGDLVERILGTIPPSRIDDVVLLDPTDEEYAIGFNILSAHSDFERNLLASDLVSIFKRLSTSWGDQMGSVLNNAILAFLESAEGGTLADLRHFLLDTSFRNAFLKTVRDPEICYYWQKAFPQLGGNKSIGPILTRLETFLSPKPIRYMVSQKNNRLDFGNILDTGKIFLAKLPQGQIGKENSFLLGSLLVSKFQQLAMSRQRLAQKDRRDAWLYIDEFHYFITPSMSEILTGARKYRLGLVLAHHELHQLQRDSEVASAVLSHPYTRIVFRVGDSDARELEKGFSTFEARDLQNLPIGEAVCRIERSDFDFNLKVLLPEEIDPEQAAETRAKVITASREKYATPRSVIEAELLVSHTLPETEKTSFTSVSIKTEKPDQVPAATAQPIIKRDPVAPPSFPSVPVREPLEPIPSSIMVPRPKTPNPMGKGGVQHKAIQKRLKAIADSLGFLSTIEAPISCGPQSVDLLLERDAVKIACEIAITTTIDHEVGNVQKCVEAGYSHVAVLAIDEERLKKIRTAVLSSLGHDACANVGFYSPDSFIAYLEALPREASPSVPKITIRRGYKTTRTFAQTPREALKDAEEAQIRVIADVLQSARRRTKR